MTRLRALLVGATIAGSIALSLAAIAADRLLWPFAHYPMYSERFGPRTELTRAVGVTADGRELPLPRPLEPRGLLLHFVVRRAERRPDAPERLARIATAIGTEYERQRSKGGIDGPPLAAVRLYRDTIDLASQPHVRTAVRLAEGRAP
jgi:hypothetical protein